MIETKNCCGCSACLNICPKKCIKMIQDEEGFIKPYINKIDCVHCNLCNSVCLKENNLKKTNDLYDAYALVANKPQILMNSSSGGFFSIIAQYIIKNNGYVVGVSFDDNMKSCSFKITNKIEEINSFCGSKYFQASINYIYQEVKNKLNNGNLVLFSGLPCQVYGLKLFLKKEYSNLITIEIICHGVPSQKIWIKYLSFITNDSSKVDKANFRKKDKSIEDYKIEIDYDNKKYSKIFNEDIYGYFFAKNLNLNESCYNCKAKNNHSNANFTIGDYWGVKYKKTNLNYKNGISLVILNNQKAKEIFDEIKNEFQYEKIEFNYAIKFNTSYNHSPKRPVERNEFYNDLNKFDFKCFTKKYYKFNIKSKLKKILKKSFIGKKIISMKYSKRN